MQSNT